MQSNKYLVILGGSPRGGELAWKSLYKYVTDHLEADLAICTGKKWIKNQSFVKKAKYKWIFDEPDDWLNYYKENKIQNWQNAFNLPNGAGLIESGLIHFAIKDIIRKNYIEIVKEYDYVIFTRFDQLYVDYHIRGFEGNVIIPSGEDYFGLHDRHIVFPSKLAEKYFGIMNYFTSNYKSFEHLDYVNCEIVNKYHLESFLNTQNIVRSKRFQFTVANKDDPTNWRKAKIKLRLIKDLYLKYPDEFLDSLKNYLDIFHLKKLDFNSLVFIFNFYLRNLRIKLSAKLKN